MNKYQVTLKSTDSGRGVDDTEIIEASSTETALIFAGATMLAALLMDNPLNVLRMPEIVDDLARNYEVTIKQL